MRSTVGLIGVVIASLTLVRAQAPSQNAASPAAIAEGAELFKTYCASCHGEQARGNGPLAERLRHAPPDLTTFTARNGGVFPSARVHRIIDGRDVASHGDREMPVWGDAFRTSRAGFTADAVKRRIEALVKYLEAIQQRAAE